jgi:nucleotide-binding universal stress UspA family protein
MTTTGPGPVLFAYDGSDLAKAAIKEAARLLGEGRDALVLTVWRPADVGFLPRRGIELNAARSDEVKKAAAETAAEGAALAEAAGFSARSIEANAAPTWKAIIGVAEKEDASLIVLGSRGRSGITGIFVGSTAGAVAGHCGRSVLITHCLDDLEQE